MSSFAALCHLLAPAAVSGRVPTGAWVRIGLMVSASVFVGAGLIVFNLD